VFLSELPPLNPNENIGSSEGNSKFIFFIFSFYFLLMSFCFLGPQNPLAPSTVGSTPQQKDINQSNSIQVPTGNVQRDAFSNTSPNAVPSSPSPKKVPGYHIAKFPSSGPPKSEGKSLQETKVH
jgi:hypothetical protein